MATKYKEPIYFNRNQLYKTKCLIILIFSTLIFFQFQLKGENLKELEFRENSSYKKITMPPLWESKIVSKHFYLEDLPISGTAGGSPFMAEKDFNFRNNTLGWKCELRISTQTAGNHQRLSIWKNGKNSIILLLRDAGPGKTQFQIMNDETLNSPLSSISACNFSQRLTRLNKN